MSLDLAERPATRPAAVIEAELNYLGPVEGRPFTYTYPRRPGSRAATSPPRRTAWRSATCGRSPARCRWTARASRWPGPSALRDFDDEAAIRAVYYPESARILQAATGAARVHIFDHTIRRQVPGAEDRAGAARQPVARVHVDHTERSGPQRVRDLLPDEAEALLRGRVQIVNLWRPIAGPVRDMPLAVCDATTVAPADLVASDLIYPDRRGETYQVRFNPAHRWYWLPEMTTEEALLLKVYDSARDGTRGSRRTPPSPIPARRRTPRRGRASSCARCSSTRRDRSPRLGGRRGRPSARRPASQGAPPGRGLPRRGLTRGAPRPAMRAGEPRGVAMDHPMSAAEAVGPAAGTPDPLGRARALARAIAAAAPAIEATRRIPADLAEALHARACSACCCRARPAATRCIPATYLLAIEEMARHDASVAWNLFVANSTVLIAAYLAPDVAATIFGDPRAVLAWGPPNETVAEAVPGGYRVSGRFDFASGCHLATWMGVHCRVREADGGSGRTSTAGRRSAR